jgi:hypothetical protein
VDGIRALPSHLTYLRFGYNFNQPFIVNGVCVLPDEITQLFVCGTFQQHLIMNGVRALPISITDLHIYTRFAPSTERNDALPPCLTKLNLSAYPQKEFPSFRLPNTLLHLVLGCWIDARQHNMLTLPKSCTQLTFNCCAPTKLVNDDDTLWLPNTITNLTLGNNFDKPLIVKHGHRLISGLHEGLVHLTFGEIFNQPLYAHGVRALPGSLTHLRLGQDFRQTLVVYGTPVLPANLTHVHFFDPQFRQPKLLVNGVRALPDNVVFDF